VLDAEVVFDGRWAGDHGIGRFATEVSSRLPWRLETIGGAHPVSMRGIAELDVRAWRARRRSKATHFLSPGYCPPMRWPGSFSFTIHDLIHLDVPGEQSAVKRLYYERVVRPAAHRALVVYTVSEFSRGRIVEWAGLDEERVLVVGNGVDERFFAQGPGLDRGRPYLLHVGNHKPHKNLRRLISAFADMERRNVDLVLTGAPEASLVEIAAGRGVADRVVFAGKVPEEMLRDLYRGAAAVVIPSLHEGFGLPALEAMAAGRPVVASNVAALPEVVGSVGILVDPHDVDSITGGLDRAIAGGLVAEDASRRGPERAREFTWDAVARRMVAGTSVE
jgi:glycosyltransferase involved in cell wall biosynthesis